MGLGTRGLDTTRPQVCGTSRELLQVPLPLQPAMARNMEGDGAANGVWCFTSDEHKKWELCPVPSCPEEVFPPATQIQKFKTKGKQIMSRKNSKMFLNFPEVDKINTIAEFIDEEDLQDHQVCQRF